MAEAAGALVKEREGSFGPPDDAERACWVAFNRTPGIAARRVRQLLAAFGCLAEAWRAPRTALRAAGLDSRAAESIESARKTIDPQRELERTRRAGVRVLTWLDAEYPSRLAAIADPPPVLYVRGALTRADEFALAMVGTRRPTLYGRDVAERLAAELTSAGITIVSGLAKGIDTHAHRGALEAGGRTIAVLGHGLDTVYPPENRNLARQIVGRGAVVSDYALGIGPAAENFPPRNRIISGLAAGVLVVEAGEKSGALITSRFAGEQGRDVFAVPGPITSPASAGCHRLIQDGAKLVAGADDVILELNPHTGSFNVQQMRLDLAALSPAAPASSVSHVPIGDPTGGGSSAVEDTVLRLLAEAAQSVHVDQIARHTGVPVHEVTGLLALLEVQGRVRHAGAMRYALAR